MKVYENLDLENEIWKEIEGCNRDYFISNLGRVKSFKRCRGINERVLIQSKDSNGYFQINLYKNKKGKTKKIHTLMFESFNNYKLKKNECVHHIDFTTNNFLDNFQLMTKGEHTILHHKGENSYWFGKHRSEETKELIREKNKGENGSNSTLKEQDIIQIRKLSEEGILTQTEIAKMFGVNQTTISKIKLRKCWKHI